MTAAIPKDHTQFAYPRREGWRYEQPRARTDTEARVATGAGVSGWRQDRDIPRRTGRSKSRRTRATRMTWCCIPLRATIGSGCEMSFAAWGSSPTRGATAPLLRILWPAKRQRRQAREREKQDAEDEARRRWYANQLWKLRQPIQGTLAEAYLRIGRSFGNLPLPPLDMLGFLPAGVPDRKIPYPAMIAAHGLPEEYEPGRLRIDEVSGVRLTFLDGPRKAPMPELPDGQRRTASVRACRS